MNALKRRRGQIGDCQTTQDDENDLVWSDTIIPRMSKKRTAFAACIGTAWPKGYCLDESGERVEAIDDIPLPRDIARSRSIWPDLVHEWLQGNVL